MDENVQTLHGIHGNSNVSNEIIYHAVYIPEENIDSSIENSIKGKYIKIKSYLVIFL